MKKIYSLILFAVLTLPAASVKAQLPLLRSLLHKVASYKNISYTSVTRNEGFVGENADTIQTFQTSSAAAPKQAFELATAHARDAFDGRELLSINLSHKYYSLNQDYRYSGLYFNSIPIFKLTETINNVIKSPEKIKWLPDTTVSSIRCHHIQMMVSDTLIRGKRSYNRYDLYLNKSNDLPIYAENQMTAFIEKGGYTSEDVIRLVNRNWYRNYKFNQPANSGRTSTKIPSGFMTLDEYNISVSEKPQPLLTAGAKAPEWKLQDLSGAYLSSAELKGKIIVMDFWGNCGACILAGPTISRLHTKYKDSDVAFVSINIDSKEEAAKFVKKYDLSYPVYINGKALYKEYHVTPIPTFYIIDPQGKVVTAMEGFSDEFEKEITAKIQSIKR